MVIIRATLALLFLVLLIARGVAPAQVGETYELTWTTMGGDCIHGTDGSYELCGTVGQSDAGVLKGGVYLLSGGFWPRVEAQHDVFLPWGGRKH